MIAVIETETGVTESHLAVDTNRGTEILMTESGRTVARKSPLMLLSFMDLIRTSKKRM